MPAHDVVSGDGRLFWECDNSGEEGRPQRASLGQDVTAEVGSARDLR